MPNAPKNGRRARVERLEDILMRVDRRDHGGFKNYGVKKLKMKQGRFLFVRLLQKCRIGQINMGAAARTNEIPRIDHRNHKIDHPRTPYNS